MAPNQNFVLTDERGEPVSRTYQYRKVMKPMLERKRRARINHCLDELKELMTGALQTEGENVAKLEKADILELTVHHLHNLRRQNQLGSFGKNSYAEKFKAGFRQCAAEVGTFLDVIDQDISVRILKHLNGCMSHIDTGRQGHNGGGAGDFAPQMPTHENRQNFHNQFAGGKVPISPAHVQQHLQQHKALVALQMDQSKRGFNYPASAQPKDLMTHLHTPPLSPKIDVDDSSVWRPW